MWLSVGKKMSNYLLYSHVVGFDWAIYFKTNGAVWHRAQPDGGILQRAVMEEWETDGKHDYGVCFDSFCIFLIHVLKHSQRLGTALNVWGKQERLRCSYSLNLINRSLSTLELDFPQHTHWIAAWGTSGTWWRLTAHTVLTNLSRNTLNMQCTQKALS